ncbi:unnamed protein product [Didymodactylos carnosus]|uniref:IF rod domain-containing protein n=1 Tax=Didymodactylos carnosus TaxID=1234261 RepID=A0A8S2XCS3_9BILA|nr:unnamed protein product [Didymodactylos carnosus]
MTSPPRYTTVRHTVLEQDMRALPNSAALSEDGRFLVINTIRGQHEYEKEELSKLNNRFMTYIGRVKQLESINKHVQVQLDELRRLWGLDSTRSRHEYDPLLDKARQTMEMAVISKIQSEIQMRRSEFDMFNHKRLYGDIQQWRNADQAKMNLLESTLKENQAEIEHLRVVLTESKTDIDKYRADIKQLQAEFLRLLDELDLQTTARVRIENEKQTIEEQIRFLSLVHEQEINELNLLASGSITIDSTTFYKQELERCIREIRQDFEHLSQVQRQELQEYYRMKAEELVQQAQRHKQTQMESSYEVRDVSMLPQGIMESKQVLTNLQSEYNAQLTTMSELEAKLETLRRENGYAIDQHDRQIIDLRGRLQLLLAAYDEIVTNKSTLEFEINTYRRLLDSQSEHIKHVRIVEVQAPVVEQTETSSSVYTTTFQRSAKGKHSSCMNDV